MRVLIIDDAQVIRTVLSRAVSTLGHESVAAAHPDELQPAEIARCDLALVDHKLDGGRWGSEVGLDLKEHHPFLYVVMLTAYGEMRQGVMNTGAFDSFVAKPLDPADLVSICNDAANFSGQWRRDNGIPCNAGRSMWPAYSQANAIAKTGTAVLLLGDTGVGKGHMAGYIHKKWGGAGAEPVTINCAAIPAETLESELFGHMRGAFTGATADKPGLFEAAATTTLFLDEIGDLPLSLQPKLLRALREKKMRRMGATRETDVTARVIAATNIDLDKAMDEGRFRRDLYARLAGSIISIPPLNARRDEIKFLAEDFLQFESRASPLAFSDQVLQAILLYSWPRNVAELQAYVKRWVIAAKGSSQIRLVHTPELRVAADGGPLAGLRVASAEAGTQKTDPSAVTTSSATPGSRLVDLCINMIKDAAGAGAASDATRKKIEVALRNADAVKDLRGVDGAEALFLALKDASDSSSVSPRTWLCSSNDVNKPLRNLVGRVLRLSRPDAEAFRGRVTTRGAVAKAAGAS